MPGGRRSIAAVRREAAAGDDAVQMGVQRQGLPPSVEHGEETDLGTQMFGIGCDRLQRLGCCAEENAVDRRLVLMGDGGNLFGQRQHDMEILRGEKFGAPIVEPLGAGE